MCKNKFEEFVSEMRIEDEDHDEYCDFYSKFRDKFIMMVLKKWLPNQTSDYFEIELDNIKDIANFKRFCDKSFNSHYAINIKGNLIVFKTPNLLESYKYRTFRMVSQIESHFGDLLRKDILKAIKQKGLIFMTPYHTRIKFEKCYYDFWFELHGCKIEYVYETDLIEITLLV